MKSDIVKHLGQTDILLPALVAEGLAANDRVKVRLSVLQAAARRIHVAGDVAFELADECRAAGIDAMAMENLVRHARKAGDAQVLAPGLRDLGTAIWQDVAAMAQAVKAADAASGDAFLWQLDVIKQSTSLGREDTIGLDEVTGLMAISSSGNHGLHRLVMDLHRALNALAAEHAEEILDGAHVYGLAPEDRGAVAAFMRGLDATRKLKFNHPGLATTAARLGARLTIQNDIGETDAHVLVVSVEGKFVTVTYTDVHLPRAKFFTGLLRAFAVAWSGLDRKSAEGLGDDGVFYLVSGRYAFAGEAQLDAFLEAVGASVVFLIDWNKARKLLRNWISKSDAVAVLDWAARERVGHRALFELGGGELVATAVHRVASARIGFGERLDSTLGREAAVEFLKAVLRICTETLLSGHSARIARYRIEAELIRHLQGVNVSLLAVVTRQAGLLREIGSDVAAFLAALKAGAPADGAALASRARRIEEKADRIAIEARREVARLDADPVIVSLVNRVEDAIDEMEQAAFVASLVPGTIAEDVLAPVGDLCAEAIEAAEAAASGVAAAAAIPEGQHVDTEDALAAAARLIEVEHAADRSERAITTIVLRGVADVRTALWVLDFARAMERSTDHMAGFGHKLREHVLKDLSA